jgi:3-hydroxyacyl-[acyl-carrier-protein] dehydratase
MSDVVQLDMLAILKRLPHRHPMLLVDRVLECHPRKSIRALKNVTYNEPFFPGHFPGRPVMPGVLVLEALAQTAGILCFVTAGIFPDENSLFYLVSIDKARFRRPVVPGDQLTLEADVERVIRGIWRFSARALVGESVVASANIMLALEAEA